MSSLLGALSVTMTTDKPPDDCPQHADPDCKFCIQEAIERVYNPQESSVMEAAAWLAVEHPEPMGVREMTMKRENYYACMDKAHPKGCSIVVHSYEMKIALERERRETQVEVADWCRLESAAESEAGRHVLAGAFSLAELRFRRMAGNVGEK